MPCKHIMNWIQRTPLTGFHGKSMNKNWFNKAYEMKIKTQTEEQQDWGIYTEIKKATTKNPEKKKRENILHERNKPEHNWGLHFLLSSFLSSPFSFLPLVQTKQGQKPISCRSIKRKPFTLEFSPLWCSHYNLWKKLWNLKDFKLIMNSLKRVIRVLAFRVDFTKTSINKQHFFHT